MTSSGTGVFKRVPEAEPCDRKDSTILWNVQEDNDILEIAGLEMWMKCGNFAL